MGLLIGGAVFPTAFAITWRKQTKVAAISGCLSGLAAGLTAWLSTAKSYYGEITVETTGMSYPTLAGNLAAIMTGLIVTTTITLIKPDDFDWEITRAINAVVTDGINDGNATTPRDASTPELSDSGEKNVATDATMQPEATAAAELPPHLAPTLEEPDDPSTLRRAFKLACISAFLLTFILDFLLPMPMFFSHYIFSKGFFTGWVVVSFIWVFASSAISCILPIWETRGSFGKLFKKMGQDLRGKK
jgi:hypothetical protein